MVFFNIVSLIVKTTNAFLSFYFRSLRVTHRVAEVSIEVAPWRSSISSTWVGTGGFLDIIRRDASVFEALLNNHSIVIE